MPSAPRDCCVLRGSASCSCRRHSCGPRVMLNLRPGSSCVPARAENYIRAGQSKDGPKAITATGHTKRSTWPSLPVGSKSTAQPESRPARPRDRTTSAHDRVGICVLWSDILSIPLCARRSAVDSCVIFASDSHPCGNLTMLPGAGDGQTLGGQASGRSVVRHNEPRRR